MLPPFSLEEPITTEPITRFPSPSAWWSASNVGFRGPNPLEIVYDLEPGLRNPLDHRDRRGRRLLEAFTALPLPQVGRDLRAYWGTRQRRVSLRKSQRALLHAGKPLVSFVEEFGPIGVGWGAEYLVAIDSQIGESIAPLWLVADFYGVGPGRWGAGRLKPMPKPMQGAAWDRFERDRSLYFDDLDRLVHEHRDLTALVRLLQGLDARVDDRRLAALTEEALNARGSDSMRLDTNKSPDWHAAIRREVAFGASIEPWGRDWAAVIWPKFAALVSADLITRQLNWVQLRAEASEGKLVRSLRATSLLEFIYLQLLEHRQRRTLIGLIDCPVCGGVVLQTRRNDATRNRYHRGCGAALRTRHSRQRSDGRQHAPPPELEFPR